MPMPGTPFAKFLMMRPTVSSKAIRLWLGVKLLAVPQERAPISTICVALAANLFHTKGWGLFP